MKHLVFVIDNRRKTIDREQLNEQHCDYAFETKTPADAVYEAYKQQDRAREAFVVVTGEGKSHAFTAKRGALGVYVSCVPNVYLV